MTHESDIWLVWQAFLPTLGAIGRIEPLGGGGGWSGSRLWRLATATAGEYCLRRWPQEHPQVERLQFIHDVLLAVGRHLPIVATPVPAATGATFLHHDGHLWELTPWLAGEPDHDERPRQERLIAAMRALATFHQLAGSWRTLRGPALAIADRQRLIEGARTGDLQTIALGLSHPLDDALDVRCQRLLELVSRVLSERGLRMPPSCGAAMALLPSIRDIHREHVLFTGNVVTGMVDFGAMRIDTPLTDVARLLGSLVGDNEESRQIARQAYAEIRPLSAGDERLIDWLDASGQVGAAIHWLRWLYVERRELGPVMPITNRIQSIEARLEHLLGNAHAE